VTGLDLLVLDEDQSVDVEQETVLGDRLGQPDAVHGAEVLDSLAESVVDLLEDALEVDPALLERISKCIAVVEPSEGTGGCLMGVAATTLALVGAWLSPQHEPA